MIANFDESKVHSTIQDMLQNDNTFKDKEIHMTNITDDKMISFMNNITNKRNKFKNDRLKYSFNISKPVYIFGEKYITDLPFSSKFLLGYEIINTYFENNQAFNIPVVVSNEDFCIVFQFGSKSMLSFSSYILEKLYDDIIEFYKEAARHQQSINSRFSGLIGEGADPKRYSNNIKKQFLEEEGDLLYKSLSMNTMYNTSYVAYTKILLGERKNLNIWEYIKHYWKEIIHCIKCSMFSDARFKIYTRSIY